MHDVDLPATLGAAIAQEPLWLKIWVMLLVITHLLAILTIVYRREGRWGVRAKPIAIVLSFFAAAMLMNWIYSQVGYVRLLGLAHLVFWTPVYVWVFMGRASVGIMGIYGKYIHLYLIVAGISLFVDTVDLLRYLLGDGQLM